MVNSWNTGIPFLHYGGKMSPQRWQYPKSFWEYKYKLFYKTKLSDVFWKCKNVESFFVMGRFGDRIYIVYNIKITMSMEYLHKTWKPNMCMCACLCACELLTLPKAVWIIFLLVSHFPLTTDVYPSPPKHWSSWLATWVGGCVYERAIKWYQTQLHIFSVAKLTLKNIAKILPFSN